LKENLKYKTNYQENVAIGRTPNETNCDVSQKTCRALYFLNNSVKHWSILETFCTQNRKET